MSLPAAWSPAARTRALADQLVHWQSVGGTAGEAAFAPKLRDLLQTIPHFRDNPGDLLLLTGYGEPDCANLIAILPGRSSRALLMAGHYDTVAIDNYRDLAPLACAPEELAQALLADLQRREISAQEALARVDLESGDFIPGRGMLDMKSGLAAGIAVLEHLAAQPDREATLILVATPDEERESRGMRALRAVLPGLLAQRGLAVGGAINLDVTSDQGDGAVGRAVYTGTIGKLLPFAFVLGQPSHAAYPFEGVSAALIAAEILRAIEGNPDLADTGAGDVAPPPIALEMRDLRTGYEVTTPDRLWLAFNWLYHSGTAQDRLDQFQDLVAEALERATTQFAVNARAFGGLSGAGMPQAATPRLLTFAELRAAALTDPVAEADFAAQEAALSHVDNPLTLSRALVEWLIERAGLTGPAVVIGVAGLHYPPASLDPQIEGHAALLHAIQKAEAAMAAETKLTWRPYFQGISDMSFLGQPARAGDGVVAANTPATRLIDRPAADSLEFPVVNIGPWGREFHQRLERVHAGYAFDILPRLLVQIVTAYFDKKQA